MPLHTWGSPSVLSSCQAAALGGQTHPFSFPPTKSRELSCLALDSFVLAEVTPAVSFQQEVVRALPLPTLGKMTVQLHKSSSKSST